MCLILSDSPVCCDVTKKCLKWKFGIQLKCLSLWQLLYVEYLCNQAIITIFLIAQGLLEKLNLAYSKFICKSTLRFCLGINRWNSTNIGHLALLEMECDHWTINHCRCGVVKNEHEIRMENLIGLVISLKTTVNSTYQTNQFVTLSWSSTALDSAVSLRPPCDVVWTDGSFSFLSYPSSTSRDGHFRIIRYCKMIFLNPTLDKNWSCSGIYCKMKFGKTKNLSKPNNIFVALSKRALDSQK